MLGFCTEDRAGTLQPGQNIKPSLLLKREQAIRFIELAKENLPLNLVLPVFRNSFKDGKTK